MFGIGETSLGGGGKTSSGGGRGELSAGPASCATKCSNHGQSTF